MRLAPSWHQRHSPERIDGVLIWWCKEDDIVRIIVQVHTCNTFCKKAMSEYETSQRPKNLKCVNVVCDDLERTMNDVSGEGCRSISCEIYQGE